MPSRLFLDLAAYGLRMPIGTDLLLYEQPDSEACRYDGAALGCEDATLVPKKVVLFGNLPTKTFYSDTVTPLTRVVSARIIGCGARSSTLESNGNADSCSTGFRGRTWCGFAGSRTAT